MSRVNRLVHAGAAVVALGLLSGCGSLSLSALHDPLYRASAHLSTITATATDAKDGVAEVRIDVIEGDLTACTETGIFMPSLVPCRANAVARGMVCVFANTKSPAACPFPLQLGDRRLVTYTASARSGSGRTTSTQAVTYAAGAPLTQAELNILGLHLTMAWETARPVIWRTDAPAGGTAPADKIDVGFFPDADFGTNYQAFTDGLQTIALGSFYNTTNDFAKSYTLWKNLFNLWAGPAGADGEGCTRTFSGSAATIAGVTDG